MSRLATDRFRLWRRWLLPAALLAVAPKCLLCLAAYVGIGAAVLGGREFCGGTESAGWSPVLAAAFALLVGGGIVVRRVRARHRYRVGENTSMRTKHKVTIGLFLGGVAVGLLFSAPLR